MTCCLLHNLKREELEVDPFDNKCDHDEGIRDLGYEYVDIISSVETSNELTTFRDNLAKSMFVFRGNQLNKKMFVFLINDVRSIDMTYTT